MKKPYFNPEKDGVCYLNKTKSNKGMIAMLGNSSDDRMAFSGVKWLHKLDCNVLTMPLGTVGTIIIRWSGLKFGNLGRRRFEGRSHRQIKCGDRADSCV